MTHTTHSRVRLVSLFVVAAALAGLGASTGACSSTTASSDTADAAMGARDGASGSDAAPADGSTTPPVAVDAGTDASPSRPIQCDPDTKDSACVTCIRAKCCDTWAACLGAPTGSCRKYATCIEACPEDASACAADCAAAEPEGKRLNDALEVCATGACPACQ